MTITVFNNYYKYDTNDNKDDNNDYYYKNSTSNA
jgi:hypothetical protein